MAYNDFLISENGSYFLISRIRIFDIKNHFLISEIQILDIKIFFSDKYLKNIKMVPHTHSECHQVHIKLSIIRSTTHASLCR